MGCTRVLVCPGPRHSVLPYWVASLICVLPGPHLHCSIMGLIIGILADPAGVPRNSRAVDGFFPSLDFQVYIFNEACILFPHVSMLFSSFFEDDDDEVGDDEDEDDGFFVPHGYLSEDEGVTEVSGEVSGSEKSSVRGWNLVAADLGRVPMGPSCHGRSLEP